MGDDVRRLNYRGMWLSLGWNTGAWHSQWSALQGHMAVSSYSIRMSGCWEAGLSGCGTVSGLHYRDIWLSVATAYGRMAVRRHDYRGWRCQWTALQGHMAVSSYSIWMSGCWEAGLQGGGAVSGLHYRDIWLSVTTAYR